ncbi:MAG: GTP 3',8-cyclase MoaA [Gammaproteobacteria bacterium]
MSLIDSYQRPIDYIRLSVTDRCDLRCSYCLPKGFKDFQEPGEWLSFDEIERIIRAFSELGTHQVRITGGEPLVRKHLPELVARLAALPRLDDLSLSTNATRLDTLAQPLAKAGISRINVSLDTLRAERYKAITGGKLQKTLDGLMAAKAAGLQPVKINMVVMQDTNEDEVEDMVEFCLAHDFTLRFIETMPMGTPGQAAQQQYVDLKQIKQRLAQRYELIPGTMPGGGPARYVRVAGTDLRIGFITPMSQHFCETCNRVRLSVDGTLHLCLGQNDQYPLRDLLRRGVSDEELKGHIQAAIAQKPERHHFNESPTQVVRFMSMTGG